MPSHSDDGTRVGLTHYGKHPAAGKLQRNPTTENPRPITSQSAAQVAGSEPLGDGRERVSDALVALDRDWRYTYVNRQAAELFGRHPEDLLANTYGRSFPKASDSRSSSPIKGRWRNRFLFRSRPTTSHGTAGSRTVSTPPRTDCRSFSTR